MIRCRAVGCGCGEWFESFALLARHLGHEKLPGKKAKRIGGKYGVAKKEDRTAAGIVYASRAESIRAQELAAQVAAGLLLVVIEQPKVRLGVPENIFRPDFFIVSADSVLASPPCWFEEVKGVETAKFKRDVKLWQAYGRAPLRVFKRVKHCWEVREIRGGLDRRKRS